MNQEQIQNALDELANYQAEVNMLNLEKQRLLAEALPPEVAQRLAEIEAEFAGKAESGQAKIELLTAGIKTAIIEYGASIKGTFLHAVYTKGRETWDGKSLKGFSAAHPEILAFLKVGEPSVSLRNVK